MGANITTVYYRKYKKLTEISDEQIPFIYKQPLSIVTEEELQVDGARLKEEEKEWREEAHKAHERRGGNE